LKIGEETGNVPGSLRNIADTYENELNIALKVMTNMIEPVMIVVMAGGVAFLLVSVPFGDVRHDFEYRALMNLNAPNAGALR